MARYTTTSGQKVNTKTKSSSGGSSSSAQSLANQLKGVSSVAKSLGIDTRKADAMVSQTERQGSRSFAGSREEKAYIKDVQANPIPVTGMQPQTPVVLPPTPTPAPLPTGTSPTDLATYYGLATNTATTDTATTGATGAPATDPFLQAMQMQKDLFEKESPNAGKELARLERQYDITQKQADVTNLKGQLGAITASAQQQTLALENQGRGIPLDILSTQAYEIQRRAAIAALPIAAQLDAAQGDLQMAQQRVDRLFQVRMADATAQYNFKSKVIDSIANYADKQETKRLEEVRYQQQIKLRKEEQNFSLVSDWAKMAFESGQSTLGGRIMALDPASPTFKTDFARLQGQVVKPGDGLKAPEVKTINGVDMQWNSTTGQWETIAGAANAPQETFKSQVATQGRTAVNTMLGIATKNPEIFGKSAALWLPDFVRSDAYRNYQAQLDALKGNIVPAALTAMREASKTGGALGNVSDKEGDRLAASLGALSMSQTPEQVVTQLKQIDASLARWQDAVNQHNSTGGNIVVTPDGLEVEIID